MEKIKVFGYPWHLAHQYELAKLPFIEWYWLKQYKRPYSTQPRGDFMVNWVDHYEPGKYDLAVLHLDQQCVTEGIWNHGKGRCYQDLNRVIQDIPKIVLNHATPYYPEAFTNDILNEDYARHGISSELIRKMKEAVGDNPMVVNSQEAAKQWGWGTPIIHGLDPAEWWDLPKEPRVVTMISPGGLDYYYDRAFMNAVKELLAEKGILHCQITVDYVPKSWDDYRKFLGSSLVYFNPTRESPMPRSRTEAMFSGCCVITTPWQDADTFIEHGVNGFLTPRNPEAAVELIEWCLNNYQEALKIGEKGRETALEKFHMERYQRDWANFISQVLGRKVWDE